MVGVLVALALACGPDLDANPIAASNEAMRLVGIEAQEAVETRRLPRRTASFAEHFPHEIELVTLQRRLMRRGDRDPMIDAYVRWQITGFDVALEQMTFTEFGRFLDDLPALIEDPRADAWLVQAISSVTGEEQQLDAPTAASLKSRWGAVGPRRRVAARLNTAGLGLREWIISQVDADNGLLALAHLERMQALVAGGWPVEQAISVTSEAFDAIAANGGVPLEEGRRLAAILEQLAGQRRMAIAAVSVTDERRVEVKWVETALDDFRLRALLRSLKHTEGGGSDGFLGHDYGSEEG